MGVKPHFAAGRCLALTRQLTSEAEKGGILLKVAKILLFAALVSNFWAISAEAAVLRLGDNNAEVAMLQERLRSLGYKVVESDGRFGERTEAAVMDLQVMSGLEVDGIVGNATWDVLRSGSKTPSRGRTVSTVQLLNTAEKYVGVPYVWGGTAPTGFDCSGYVQYVFKLSGVNLPRTADIQYKLGTEVGQKELQPGDLVFFSTYEPGPSHVGIYMGNGKFINATSSRGIAIDRMDNSYWKPRYIGARRIIC